MPGGLGRAIVTEVRRVEFSSHAVGIDGENPVTAHVHDVDKFSRLMPWTPLVYKYSAGIGRLGLRLVRQPLFGFCGARYYESSSSRKGV